MNKLRCLILFTICLLCVGCENPCENILPYYITDKYISVGQEKDLFEFAGAYIEIFNNTDLEVEQVTVNFMLYDENGKSYDFDIYGLTSHRGHKIKICSKDKYSVFANQNEIK